VAELAQKGIRVNAIVPGLIAAGMTVRLDREIAARKKSIIPAGRFGTPEDVFTALRNIELGYTLSSEYQPENHK
jgi:3-oxoacyl-[acyl-carrier protein] reductase